MLLDKEMPSFLLQFLHIGCKYVLCISFSKLAVEDSFVLTEVHICFNRQVAKAVSCTQLENIENMTGDYDVIGIDEGQFVSIKFVMWPSAKRKCGENNMLASNLRNLLKTRYH